jgi:hypothetical protein
MINELRIGNLFTTHINLRGSWAEKQRFDGEIYRCNRHTFMSDTETEKIFKPIPLSEEWLIRFGFLLEDLNWYKNDSDDSFYISFESDYGFYVGATTYGYLKAILYVHQLQNLYFALTGKELTIEK